MGGLFCVTNIVFTLLAPYRVAANRGPNHLNGPAAMRSNEILLECRSLVPDSPVSLRPGSMQAVGLNSYSFFKVDRTE